MRFQWRVTQNEKEAIKISLAFKINLAYGLELWLGVMGVRKGEAHFNLKCAPKPYGNWMKKVASKKRRMRVNLRTDRSLKILVICPPTAPTSWWEGAFMSKDSAWSIRGFREGWPDWWSPCCQEILGKEVLTQENSDEHKSMSKGALPLTGKAKPVLQFYEACHSCPRNGLPSLLTLEIQRERIVLLNTII